MSPREPAKYLYDMLSSCEFLISFTAGKTIEEYRENRAVRSAIERELQIIGEALLHIRTSRPVCRTISTSSASVTSSFTATTA